MKKHHINLNEEDKKVLKDLLKKGSLKAIEFKRVTFLLELDKGKTLQEVSETVSVSYPTALTWRDKYNDERLSFLHDKARSGRPVVIDGEIRAKITALACTNAPEGSAKWSLRLLADRIVELGYCDQISYVKVGAILKKTN